MNKELEKLLETVDVLELVTQQGRRELRGFAWYMLLWGLFVAVNLGAELLLHRSLWVWLLYPTFFATTLPVAGFLWSLGVWLVAAAVSLGVAHLTHQVLPVLAAIVLTAALAYLVLYSYGIRTGRYRPLPLKIALAPRVGWSWGMVMGGMAVVFWSLAQFLPSAHLGTVSQILWGYAVGVGLLLSGVLHPVFFWIGVLAIFGIPLASAVNPVLGLWAFTLVALVMAGLGLYFWRTGENL